MKTLYVNGCSMTKYQNLPEDQQWPNLVRQQLEIDRIVNDGYGCGSNQRIFRTTFDFVNYKKFSASNTVILIQMTYPFRFEYLQANGEWAAVNQHGAVAEDLSYAKRYLNMKSKSYTDEEEAYEYLQKLYAIDNLLKKSRVRNYFFLNFHMPVKSRKIVNKLNKQFNWIVKNNSEDSHFPEYECISASDPHPNEHGHIKIADWIVQNIKCRMR